MNYEALMKKQLLHMPAYRLPPQISDMMKQYGIDSVSELYDLLMQNGIMIRNFDLNRVSVGRPEDKEKFISSVEAFMKEKAEKKVS